MLHVIGGAKIFALRNVLLDMSKSESEPDTEDLEAKVKEQDQKIEQLQKTVKKMMPGRRGVIQGGAAAAAAGILGYNSGKAKAAGLNDGDTQWGSDSNRDDYVVDHVDANSVSTEQLVTELGGTDKEPANRPLVSNESKTITVGTDTETIQEALDSVPRILRHEWVIEIPDGTYDEDLYLAGVQGIDLTHTYDGEPQGASRALKISGDDTAPSNVQVSSIFIASCTGNANPAVSGIEFTGETPYNNDGGAVHFQAVQSGSVRDCTFSSSVDIGVYCYNGTLKVSGIEAGMDFGDGDLQTAMMSKRGGNIIIRSDVTGTTTGAAHDARSGAIWTNPQSGKNVTGSPDFQTIYQGIIYDAVEREVIGWSSAKTGRRVRAYYESNATLTNNESNVVEFDVDSGSTAWDIRNEYDTSTGTFTASTDGTYHIKARLKTQDQLSESDGDALYLKVFVNDDIVSQDAHDPGVRRPNSLRM